MGECCGNICGKCSAGKYLIVGLLVLVNTAFIRLDWGVFIGLLLILKGILIIAMPNGCGHCAAPAKPSKSKK